jgi:hypothetical protein
MWGVESAPMFFRESPNIYALIAFSAGIALVSSKGNCQTSASSIDLGYRFGFLTAATHAPNIVNPGLGDSLGTSSNNTIRLSYSRDLVSLFSDNIAIRASLGVSQSFGSFFSSAFSLAYSGTFIHASAMARHEFGEIALGVGGWVDAPLSQTLTRTPAATNSILYPQWPLGFLLNVSAASWKFSGLAVQPMLFGEFDLTAYRQPNPNGNALLPFSAGLSLQWSRSSEDTPVVPNLSQASIIPQQITGIATIHSDIHFTTLGHRLAEGETVPIEAHDTLIRQYTMLPSQIGIGASHLAPEYHLLRPSDAEKFAIDSLARMDENSIARNLLNIIGARLRSSPDASVTLQYGDDHENSNYIPRYWKEAFHVSESQIVQTKGNVSSGKIGLAPTDPIVTQWIERTYALGEFGLDRNVEALRGVRSWYINLLQNGGIISHLSSTASDTAIVLQGLQAHSASSIVARFVAEDSAGDRAESFDTLLLNVQHAESESPPLRLRFIFLADSTQMDAIEMLMAKLSQTASNKVTIDYYFNKDGFPTWLEQKLQIIHGKEASHLLGASDRVGPRAVVTVWQE